MPGFLILHGGGTTAPETTRALIARAGGPDAPLVVLPQTSEDAANRAKGSVEWIKKNGAKNVSAPLVTQRTDSAGMRDAVALLEKARGVWIPGGNQNRFLELFGSTSVAAALKAIYERGGVVGGTSAGAALLGQWMPTGDDTEGKVQFEASKVSPSLNLLPGAIVDTHFFVRTRTQRLLTMILTRPETLGIGVDQDSWAEFDGKANALIVQAGQVAVFRAHAPLRRDKEGHLGNADVRLRVLLPGDTVSLGDLR